MTNEAQRSEMQIQLEQMLIQQIQADEDARILETLKNLCPHSVDFRKCEYPECLVRTIHES
jgi:hypothetical protein